MIDKIKRKNVPSVIISLIALGALSSIGLKAQTKPNIVFFFADDMGWTDLSTGRTNMGHPSDYYKTPNIAKLANQGMAFDNAYTCGPNCAPTRASLMSGQYGPRTGVLTVGNSNRGLPRYRKLDAPPNKKFLNPRIITIAETLKKAGYVTGHFGKWHLGNDSQGRGPASQGFDLNVGGTEKGVVSGGSKGHFAKSDGSFNLPNLGPNGKPYQFMANRLVDEAISFMNKNKNKPFFVYLTHFSVHTPIQAPKKDIDAFNGVPPGQRHKNQTYAGMLKNLDDNLGRVITYLENTPDPRNPGKKLISNTVIIFYSDNGGVGGYQDAGIIGAKEITHNYPIKAGKGSLYDGGIRVPLIIRWDGKITPRSICHIPVITVDFYPTLAEIGGAPLPQNQALDGESLVPILTGKSSSLKRKAIFWHFPCYLQASIWKGTWRTTPVSVIRKGDYKLLFYYETRTWELYNLSNDIGEKNNIAPQNPWIVQTMGKELREWLININAVLPYYKGTTTQVPLPGGTGDVSSFGSGCKGSAGTPLISSPGIPWIGGKFPIQVSPLPSSCSHIILVIGDSNKRWAGGNLPYSLSGIGMPGCDLLVNLSFSMIETASSGESKFLIPIPNEPSMIGKKLYSQAFVPDPGANTLGVVASNGLSIKIGQR